MHAGNRFADCSMRAKLTAGGRTDAMHDLGGVEDSLSLGLELHHTQGLEKKYYPALISKYRATRFPSKIMTWR